VGGVFGTHLGVVTVITKFEGGDAGRVQKVTDPRGLLAKTDYDLMDRVVRTIENYVNFVPAEVDDKTTEFAYDGMDHLTLLTAVLPNNAFQKTEYVYGVDASSGSDLYSNDLLRQVKYPDKSSGWPSTATADQESYKYNLLGDAKEFLDRNGTTHAYSYDVVSRLTKDAATLGTGSAVDGAIQRQEVAYDTAGRAFQFTSYNAGGTVVNQVQQAFNLGQHFHPGLGFSSGPTCHIHPAASLELGGGYSNEGDLGALRDGRVGVFRGGMHYPGVLSARLPSDRLGKP
jgi:hypothetical protein